MARTRYGIAVVLATVGLVSAAVIAYARLADGPPRLLSEFVGEATDTFAVHGASDIRPRADAYRRFAVEDSLWRLRNDLTLHHWQTALGAVWHPSQLQLLRDSAYYLVRDNRLAEAADLLGRWLARHPDDDDLRVERARLLAQSDRTDSALAEYARVVERHPADRATRDEYAGALLLARRLDDAAVQYRRLLASDPRSVPYRLGLVRALSWGDRPREAEPLLRELVATAPGDTSLVGMLRSVRAAIDPSADEAARWVADEPGYAPYRLAYARALGAARRSVGAAAQFDTLLMGGESVALLREAAGAHAAIPDSVGSARLLGRAVALAPSDTSARREYARALAWSGDRAGAIEQLGVLIRAHPDADDLLMRGRLYLWSGDDIRAEPDLVASARMAPRAETLVLLGDLLRWRGEWRRARTAYRQALALTPNDPAILASLALLDRQERLAFAGASEGVIPGWLASFRHAEDNTGYLFLAAGIERGFAIGRQTVLAFGAEQRRVSQRSARGGESYLFGYALDGGIEQILWRARLSAKAGFVKHALLAAMPYASAELSAPMGPARVSLEVSDGPAYGSRMTTRVLVPRQDEAIGRIRALRGREAIAVASIPVGRADLSLSAGATQFSDGNSSRSLQASLRVPIAPHVAALYSGGTLGYSERSDAYWTPSRYVSHAVGIEVAVRKPSGFSGAARVLPGYGRSQESIVAGGAPVRIEPRNVPQLSASYELGWQARGWRVSIDGAYGRGREGGYQSLTSNARVQLDW